MAIPARRNVAATRSLSDIFNTFARDAAQRFPDLKGRLLIMEMNEQKSYGGKTIDPAKTGLTPETVDKYLQRCKYTREMKKANAEGEEYSSMAHKDKKRNLAIIFMNELVDKSEINNVPADKEKLILNTLDHELAHLAIRDSYFYTSDLHKVIIGESIADAYSQIRYYQRYGVNDPPPCMIDSWERTRYLAFYGDTDHFTSFMLDEIDKRKDLIDFQKLTPAQTADLAWRFAMQYTPPVKVVDDLYKKFAPLRTAYEKNPKSLEWVKVLARLTLDPKNDYFTFKVCKKLLGGYLDGFSETGKPLPLNGPYWDDIRQKLKDKDAQLRESDILFNMPVVKKPPANGNTP